MNGIAGKRARVTGPDTALARAIAARLAAEGAELLGADEQPIEILVLARLQRDRRPLDELDHASWRRALEEDVVETALLVEAAAPAMAGRGYGRIVILTGDEGARGSVEAPAFATAAGALIAFVRSAARALAPRGVAINGVAPGADSEVCPEDVAAAVAFLCSTEAEAMVGQVIQVNAGRSTSWAR